VTIASALGGFYLGAKVKKRIPEKSYAAIVKGLLLVIAITIVARYAGRAG